jgi:hypothetical protein
MVVRGASEVGTNVRVEGKIGGKLWCVVRR